MIKKLIYVDTRVARPHACLGFVGNRLSEAHQLCGVGSQSKVTHACTPVDDNSNIQRGYFAVANCCTLRGLFFLPVMGTPPHCISFKRKYYKENLLQVGSVPKYRQFTQTCSLFLLRIPGLW